MLFTDLVNSTSLFGALPSADADHLRNRHFADIRGALAVHHGNEVKTLGDGFMAVFDSAGDALGCAITMQRVVERHATEAGHPVALRIGVASGDVTRAEEDYFGLPVVAASRLCALAGPRQILVSDLSLGVAGEQEGRGVDSLGPTALKGIDRPMPVSVLQWGGMADAGLRVALVDDSVLLRQGIANALHDNGVEVVLQAGDAEQLDAKLDGTDPHVVVLDVRMPPTFTTEGLEAARRIKLERPGVGVLVLSAEIQPEAARRLLATATEGVGYLLKDRVADIEELMHAIRTIAAGGSAIDPAVVALLG